MVHEADGVEKLEKLQSHANEKIYERAVKFIEKFLGVDEEEENAAPHNANGAMGQPVVIPDMNGGQQSVHATYGFPTGKRVCERERLICMFIHTQWTLTTPSFPSSPHYCIYPHI